DHFVPDRVQLFKSFGSQLGRDIDIVSVNCAKQPHQHRDEHHHNPCTVQELGDHQDDQDHQSCRCPQPVNEDGFLPMCSLAYQFGASSLLFFIALLFVIDGLG